LIEFQIDCVQYEQTFLISPELTAEAILGANFLNDYEVVLNFVERYVSTNEDDVLSRHMFFCDSVTRIGMEGELVSNPNRKLNHLNAKSPINLEGSCPHTRVRHASVFKTEVSDYQVGATKYNNIKVDRMKSVYGGRNPTFINVEEDSELREETERTDHPRDFNLCFIVSDPGDGHYSNTRSIDHGAVVDRLTYQEPNIPHNVEFGDARAISDQDLYMRVDEASSLNEAQKYELFETPLKYRDHFTTKPGKCQLMSYEFKVTSKEPIVGHSRPIPFAVRSEVRSQIKQMLADDIIEVCNSNYLHPLTVVMR
jgi:hypothetical protein